MNKAMLSVGIVFLAVLALLLINVLNNYATGGELDYYLVKETTEAAMTDAPARAQSRLAGSTSRPSTPKCS